MSIDDRLAGNNPAAPFNNDLPMPGAGLRRRAGNIGSSPFMQQATTPGGSAGPQRSMQYLPRQDAQTRYNNAVQVESTIVEVRLRFSGCDQCNIY